MTLSTAVREGQEANPEIRQSREYQTAMDPRKLMKERGKIRFAVIQEWRRAGRFDYADAELSAETERRLEALLAKRAATPQLSLFDQFDQPPTGRDTKLAACVATRSLRINRRQLIVELLESAGHAGMTREEMARALPPKAGKPVKDSSVSAPVQYLIKTGLAIEIGTRPGDAGIDVAVVVLAKFAGGTR